MKEKIVVIGGGGHAKVVLSILKKLNEYKMVGYTDITDKSDVLGVPYLGNDDKLFELFSGGVQNAVIGIGQIKSNTHRRKLVNLISKIGFKSPAIISPDSIINENVKIGNGTVVMDGVVVNSGTVVGKYSILNTRCSIDHDCKIGSFTHIAPGVTLSGEVKIGDNVLIGTGANVIQNISIVSNSLISAGSSVQRNITDAGIYRGVPAKFVSPL